MIAPLEWSKIIQAIASIATVCIAFKALTTWKQKSKADKQTEFIDEILNNAHRFLFQISAAIDIYKFIKIGIDAYADEDGHMKINDRPIYVAYIEECGREESKILFDKLEKCTDSLTQIRSLVVKGQIYGFSQYEECQDACVLITWQFDRLQSVAALIGRQSLNWQNVEVTNTIEKVLSVDPIEIEKELEEQNIRLISFAKSNYLTTYNNT